MAKINYTISMLFLVISEVVRIGLLGVVGCCLDDSIYTYDSFIGRPSALATPAP